MKDINVGHGSGCNISKTCTPKCIDFELTFVERYQVTFSHFERGKLCNFSENKNKIRHSTYSAQLGYHLENTGFYSTIPPNDALIKRKISRVILLIFLKNVTKPIPIFIYRASTITIILF